MNPTVWKFCKRLVCLALAGSAFSALANADLGPYQKIVERNPFGLNPPTPPPLPVTNAPAPPVDITLTGITDLFGPAKAYLTTKDSAGKPEHHSLSVGERSGGLEVLGIDSKAGTVKVRNGRLETVLNFKDHGAKAVAAVAPPVPGQTRPGGPPGFSPPGAPTATPTPFGTRPPTTSVPAPSGATGFTAAQPGSGTISVGTGQNAGLIAIPTRNTRTSTSPQSTTVPHPPQPNMTAEQSAVIMAVTKEANKAEIQQGKFPPLPPVPGVDE